MEIKGEDDDLSDDSDENRLTVTEMINQTDEVINPSERHESHIETEDL